MEIVNFYPPMSTYEKNFKLLKQNINYGMNSEYYQSHFNCLIIIFDVRVFNFGLRFINYHGGNTQKELWEYIDNNNIEREGEFVCGIYDMKTKEQLYHKCVKGYFYED